MEMKTLTVNNIEIAYERRGNGKPLLLIHGFPFDHTTWNGIVPLLENDFDLILPDLRGFGASSSLGTVYQISDMAKDLAGLLEHLGIEKAVVAGHSMGGYVSLAFAKDYPNQVGGLALISSQAAADTPERKEGRYKTAQEVEEKGVGVVAEAMTPKLSANAEVQKTVRELIQKQGKAGVIGALKAMAKREDSIPLLTSFNFPVVLVHGDADALIPLEKSGEMKEILPTSHLVVLPGAGHMPMLEFPKETAEAVILLK